MKEKKWFYIDDGPLFSSLSYLVDYYCRYSDGLPAELTAPIPPHPIRFIYSKNYFNYKLLLFRNPHSDLSITTSTTNRNLPSPSFTYTSHNNQKSSELVIIPPKSIILGRELGQGEFGSVLMGVWTNSRAKKVYNDDVITT